MATNKRPPLQAGRVPSHGSKSSALTESASGPFSKLFGWETSEVAPGAHYGVTEAAAQGIGGGIGSSQGAPGHVAVFAEVHDLDATLKDAERLGGKRIAGPIDFPDKRPSAHGRGSVRFAYFADPEGHVIGLWQGIVRP